MSSCSRQLKTTNRLIQYCCHVVGTLRADAHMFTSPTFALFSPLSILARFSMESNEIIA